MRIGQKMKALRSLMLPVLIAGMLMMMLASNASAQCGMLPVFGMIGACTPVTYGAGMTCTATRFVDCYVGTFTYGTMMYVAMGPGGGTLTMGVPCSAGGMTTAGMGLMIYNTNMAAGGASCMDTSAGTTVGSRSATAMGMGTPATCQVLWRVKCAVTGMLGTMTTTSCPGCGCVGLDGMAGNQTVARACNFNATPGTNNGGLPVELLDFSVDLEVSEATTEEASGSAKR